MSTRKSAKFNKNNGYKDFTSSIVKQNSEIYNQFIHSNENNNPENTVKPKLDAPLK